MYKVSVSDKSGPQLKFSALHSEFLLERRGGVRTSVSRMFSLGWLLPQFAFLLFALVVSSQAHSSCVAPANAIEAENCLPGTPYTTWDIPTFDKGDTSIQGFATDISVNRGNVVDFKVSTPAAGWRLDIYRMGYYQGNGARLVATVNPTVSLPQVQPACLSDSTTGITDCGNWAVSASWSVPANATSGIYFAKAIRNDTGGSSHIVFIVRDDASNSDILFQISDASWQAYNPYGANMYVGDPADCEGRTSNNPNCRAFKVSYNRPFYTRSFEPQTWLFNAEYPMVKWLEANAYDVSYFTNIDADRIGSLLLNHKVFMSNGHDEYWSGNQRTNVEAARDAGVNLAFFSSNSVYWKTRWENSIDGSGTPYRTLVCYKETYAGALPDPDPSTWTGTWRDPRFSPPHDAGLPENALMGTLTRIAGQYYGDITVPQSDGLLRFWRNTDIASLGQGQTYTLPSGTLGAEIHADEDNGYRPPGLFRLSATTVTAENPNQYLLDYGSTTGLSPHTTFTHALTLYRHSSGALVFSTGTYNWAWGLSGDHDLPELGNTTDINVQQATVNLFADMGVQPQTLQPGLLPATASTDTTPPQSVIALPGPGDTLSVGAPVTITGTATDGGGGVAAGVEVSTDGGTSWHPAVGRESWSYTFTPNIAGNVEFVSRAVDDSGNLESSLSPTTVNVGGTSFWTLWPLDDVPSGVLDAGPDSSLELGVKFRAKSNGFITGIRFYKSQANTGVHTGTLWTSGGVPLATATFFNESESGWQQVIFSEAVPVTANTVYVASYHTDVGHYSVDRYYFAGNGASNGPLYALGAVDGSANGVFGYGGPLPVFPTISLDATNYWVDVLFSVSPPNAGSLLSIGVSPGGQSILTGQSLQLAAIGSYSNLSAFDLTTQALWSSSNPSVAQVSSTGLVTGVIPGVATISATFDGITGNTTVSVALGPLSIVTSSLSEGFTGTSYAATLVGNGGIAPYQWSIESGSLPSGLLLDAGTGAISGVPTALGTVGFTVRANDAGNPGQSTTKALSIDISVPANSVWSDSTVPEIVDVGLDSPVELGVKFFSDSDGYVTGVRFYKSSNNTGTHVANLWNGTGKLLATTTFDVETPSGWQEVNFPEPVAITANALLVVSYHTDVGHYSYTGNYFASSSVNNPPLHMPSSGASGGNGVYSYGPARTFPVNTYNAGNYWVDAVVTGVQPITEPLAVTSVSLSSGVAGLAYSSAPLTASGGTLPYTWSIAGGALPLGLSLDPSTGIITGTPATLGTFEVTVEATDSGTPTKIDSGVLSIDIAAPATSVWNDSVIPDIVDAGPSTPLELGVRFASDMDGYITGARFYKAAANTGVHIANLWTSNGVLLATTAFANETASGWQEVSFPFAVPITAGTVYVMSYHTSVGHFSYAPGYFAGRTASNPPLRFLAAEEVGGNGVYRYEQTSAFPSSTYNATNYWVDIVYSATTPSTETLSIASSSNLTDAVVTVPYSMTLSATGGLFPFEWTLISGSLPQGLTLNSETGEISGTPISPGISSFTLELRDAPSSAQVATKAMQLTVLASASFSLWNDAVVPAIIDVGPDSQINLGVKFRADTNGHVAGVRFYKSVANTGTHIAYLWSEAGTLLASETYTSGTASGWQEVNFASPVPVVANTVYVVSYHTSVGHYSATSGYFLGGEVDSGPLHALSNTTPGGNGVYAYGLPGVFPSNSYQGAHYWVDVIFTQP